MVVIVLGCPRSGTSLMTNLLVHSGLHIGTDDLMRPNIHFNSDGYYENINTVKINDQLIRLLYENNNYNFLNIPTCSRPLIENENFCLLSSDNYKKYDTKEKILNEIKTIKLDTTSVVKDSRFVFTLDAWNLNDVFIIKVVRDKSQVKKSMEKHYGNIFTEDSIVYNGNTIPKINFDEYYNTYNTLIDSYLEKYSGLEITYEQLLKHDYINLEKSLDIKINSTVIKQKCNWCKYETKLVYEVPNSRIGAKIMYCNKCELVQSYYTNIENKHRYKSISCDSDWGNIRHGKGVRLDASIEVLKNLDVSSILDIGSNRGNFCRWASNHYKSGISIDMIEPDGNITNYDFTFDNMYGTRFEKFFKNKQYDLVYCCHTLEHLDDLHEFFEKAYRFTKQYLFIDVPNLTNVLDENNIEEFFIDKHTYHFSENGLIKMLDTSGFDITVNKTDEYNIVLLCQKRVCTFSLDDYVLNLKTNREKLVEKSEKLNKLFLQKKVVIYGATRIYDALIKYGGLEYKNAYYIVDDFSPLENVYKCDRIQVDVPDVVVILARSSIEKIKNKLKNIETIVTFQEL